MQNVNQTIIGILCERAKTTPDKIAFKYILDDEKKVEELSYKGLWNGALIVADFLRKRADTGDRVMLLFPPGLDYVKAFYGCLLAGMIAVPLYPPRRNSKSERIMGVATSCQSLLALTVNSELAAINKILSEAEQTTPSLSIHAVDALREQEKLLNTYENVGLDCPAFLQYTSGSTGSPKGVVVTHGNIIGNLRHLTVTAGGNTSDVFVNWLPLFHDFGLITAVLWPVFLGAQSILMSAASFVRNPTVWLKAISRYKGTVCGAPNFAFDLCVQRATQLDEIELGSWRVAYNAAEPINPCTLKNFSLQFAPFGFKEESFYPGYGMAEATVFISGGKPELKPSILTINKKAFSQNIVEIIANPNTFSTQLVSCGRALHPHILKIVDPISYKEMPEAEIGEIWFSGPSVSVGYWQLQELTNSTFNQALSGDSDNKYMRTGDLGFIFKGELYVTGRIKDLIVLRGKNYYPQDIETASVKSFLGLRHGHCVAFSVDTNCGESLIVVAEVERGSMRKFDDRAASTAIRKKIYEDLEINISEIVFVKPYSLPVTSSGKVQRMKTRQLYLKDGFDVIAPHIKITSTSMDEVPTNTETTLLNILHKVLNRNDISAVDNIHEFGVESLKLLELSAEIKYEYKDISLDVSFFFDFPNIKEIATYVDLHLSYLKVKGDASSFGNCRVITI